MQNLHEIILGWSLYKIKHSQHQTFAIFCQLALHTITYYVFEWERGTSNIRLE